jgi:putative tricarboxylic transport membrane protein
MHRSKRWPQPEFGKIDAKQQAGALTHASVHWRGRLLFAGATTMTTPQSSASSRSGRIAATAILILSLAYGIAGSRIAYSFSSDPLGPRFFPVMLAAILALLSLAYLVRPGKAEGWPGGSLLARSIALPMLVLVSAQIMETAGFAVAMFVLTAGVGWLFGASPLQAALGGIVQSALWYFIFGYLLEVYLPAGALFAS